MKVRIEIHLTNDEVKQLDNIAKEQGRSRKNLCETEIRKVISELAFSPKKKKLIRHNVLRI